MNNKIPQAFLGQSVEQPENITEARKKLLELESSGSFVFHGSPVNIDVLEPRQSQDRDKNTGLMVDDGDPAVSATLSADIAIFRALTANIGGASSFGMDDNGNLYFSLSPRALANLEIKANNGVLGKVYVLDKNGFSEYANRGKREWRSNEKVVPLKFIEVGFKDLPPNIKIIDDPRDRRILEDLSLQ